MVGMQDAKWRQCEKIADPTQQLPNRITLRFGVRRSPISEELPLLGARKDLWNVWKTGRTWKPIPDRGADEWAGFECTRCVPRTLCLQCSMNYAKLVILSACVYMTHLLTVLIIYSRRLEAHAPGGIPPERLKIMTWLWLKPVGPNAGMCSEEA